MFIKNFNRTNKGAFIGLFVSSAVLIFDCFRVSKDVKKITKSVNKFKKKNEE